MQKHEAFTFIDYERISDDLYFLGKGFMLKFNVQLAKKDKDRRRSYAIKEYRYKTTKYLDKNDVITIRRNFDFYLSIGVTDDFSNSVIIKPKDMFSFQSRLQTVCGWFNTLFKIKGGKLIISGKYEKQKVSGLAEGKYIEFEPAVILYEDNTYNPGVRLYVNSPDVYVDMAVDHFMGMVYLVTRMDMYQCALSIMASLPFDYGENIYQMENHQFQNPNLYDDIENGSVHIKKQQTKEERKKGFFD